MQKKKNPKKHREGLNHTTPSPTTKTFEDKHYFLNGLRITSTLLTALMWAADYSGNLNPAKHFHVLDATLNFTLTWQQPILGVPEKNVLSIDIGMGELNGTCWNRIYDNTTNHTIQTVISTGFTHLKGNGTVTLDPTTATLQIQIIDFDIADVSYHCFFFWGVYVCICVCV